MSASVTKLVARNTGVHRDFLAFHNLWIVVALFRHEPPERLSEVGKFKRGDCGRGSRLFDVAVDLFRKDKRFVNDAIGAEPASMLRIWPVGRHSTIELQEKNRSMPGDVITIIILFFSVGTVSTNHIKGGVRAKCVEEIA
jgi:hypothetical protein